MESKEMIENEPYGFVDWDGKLEEHQENCVKEIITCLDEGFTPIITSVPGSGKTVKSAMAMKRYGIERLIVVSPKCAKIKWEQALEKIFLEEEYYVFTYEDLKLQKTPFLKKKEKIFFVTEEWEECVKKYKTGIIVDEFHRLQNITLQTLAVAQLTRYIFNNPSFGSRFMAISYTGCDNKNLLINQMYVFGYIDEYKLNKITFEHFSYFMENIKRMNVITQEECEKVISNAKKIFGRPGKFARNGKMIMLPDLCLKYIFPKLTFFSVPDYVKNEKLNPDCGNLMYEVEEDEAKKINAIFDGTVETFENGKGTRIMKRSRKTTKYITEKIEEVKTTIYAKLAKDFLDRENGKVIIMVLHLNSLSILEEILKEYGVCKLEGKMNLEEREESKQIFQKNNHKVRVMIATIYTGNESIDLQDRSGGGIFQRILLLPPCYYTKEVVQSTGRVYRNGVTSRSIIRIVYTTYQNKSLEKKYYDSLDSKSKMISRCHNEKQKDYLPCNYPFIKH